jgi:rhamnogalacturonan endolyase
MKANLRFILFVFAGLLVSASITASTKGERKMWASIMDKGDASLGDYKTHTGKLLLSWRMLPTDNWDTKFYLYKGGINATYIMREGTKAINATNYQLSTVPSATIVYYLLSEDFYTQLGLEKAPTSVTGDKRAILKAVALDSVVIDSRLYSEKLPYLTIPLKSTEDVCSQTKYIKYQANDCSVGDLDGDGEMEVVVKRLLSVYNGNGECISDGTGAGDSDTRARHTIIWDAYKLDGTLLWRVKSGPNIILGNSSAVTLGDLDGDGCAEFVLKTSEGTVFGDGYEIADTDGDNKTDYRDIWPAGHYIGDGPKGYGGPEFFSVVDGKTGKELARANYIARGKEGETPAELAANWEANDWNWDPRKSKYAWKLANSFRMGLASFDGEGLQIFLGRGVYGRTIVEGWRYEPTPSGDFAGTLTRMWKFDTMDEGGRDKNKDGKLNSAYAGQGNHAFNVADLDGDGKDEVMYGSCAFDDDGTGLWTSGLGHGDANHVGRFLPDREGLQVYHCLETGKTMVALHDAKDGKVIWKKDADSDNDMGRCLVSDIDPSSPGCEFWYYGSNAFSQTGEKDLGYKPSSCNMAIWFDGSLSRQLINENIIDSPSNGRTFTMYRYNESFNNTTKSNPGWYGDFLGDWREEVIVPDQTKLADIKIFSTWYPSDYMLPYLMSDHTYMMQCIHQQVGYNQPNHVGGYFLGTGMDFNEVPLVTEIQDVTVDGNKQNADGDDKVYDLSGRQVENPTAPGIYIKNGKKFIVQ